VGARLVRAAIMRREAVEMAGRRAPWWLRQLTAVPRRLGYHLGPSAASPTPVEDATRGPQ
jgi:hypothetical protein